MLSRKQTGLTLIELVVGLAIVSIVVTMAVPSYMEVIANLRVRNVAEGLQGGMQLARAEALSRNAQVELFVGSDLGWIVRCVTVTATCPASIDTRSAGDNPPNVTVSFTFADTTTSAGPVNLEFDSLGRRVDTNPASDVVQIDVDVPTSVLPASDSRDLRLTVSPSGQIRLCDPNLPSSNPQAC